MIELTIKGDIHKLRLKKDDYVVIKVRSGKLSMEESMQINKHVREIFPNNKVVVIPENFDIEIKGA